MITTPQRLATLAVEGKQGEDNTSAGTRQVTTYRPTDRLLRNDGIQHYWMLPGLTYRLEHDGTGWRVTCRDWTDTSHIYRLAEPQDYHYMSTLTADDGADVALTPGQRYELRQEIPDEAWHLFQL